MTGELIVPIRKVGWTLEYVDDVREAASEIGYYPSGSEPLDGLAVHAPFHAIFIDNEHEGTERILELEIHELLHAYRPRWSEQTVKRAAEMLSGALWRLGYRRNRCTSR